MSAEHKGSFWTSLPGILTGSAALLTAFAGYHALIHDISDSRSDDVSSQVEETCNIKANVSRNSGAKIYHLPGDRDYNRTEIDADRGERVFCSEAEAIENGWQRTPN